MKSINNQAQNKVSISGKLLDVSFSSGKTKKGVPYERATVSDVVGIVVKGTCFGGTPFVATSRLWRFISKTWTASYRFRLWVRRLFRKK